MPIPEGDLSVRSDLAPCVAIVGPANGGKSTVVDALDAVFRTHREVPRVYVLPGSPDGTGRYLREAPELRAVLKPLVKGIWIPNTVERIRDWIEACRSTVLELVLLDFGGRLDPSNGVMLGACSHYLLATRAEWWSGDAGSQVPQVAQVASWRQACQANGLRECARALTVVGRAPRPPRRLHGLLEVELDPRPPEGSAGGSPATRELAEELLALRVARPRPSYVDLQLDRRWEPEDLATLAGRCAAIAALVRAGAPVVLGGIAPLWAYAAALHRALDHDGAVEVALFDPKLRQRFVTLAADAKVSSRGDLARQLAPRWTGSRDLPILLLEVATADRRLTLGGRIDLRHLPLPDAAHLPARALASGSCPLWLHLAYQRLLRARGVRELGVWDAGSRRAFWLTGERAPRLEPLAPESAIGLVEPAP